MSSNKDKIMEHTNELRTIKMWMLTGAISYERAKEMAKPHLDALNEKARLIGKKYGIKPKLITFASFMR
jgi:hypothetical protein